MLYKDTYTHSQKEPQQRHHDVLLLANESASEVSRSALSSC